MGRYGDLDLKMDIALGQYCEGDSLLHRLDPRVKLVTSIFFIVVIFTAKNIFSLALVAAVSAALALISKIPLRIIARSLKPIVFIALFTAVINIFWVRGEVLLFEFAFVKIYAEGIVNACLIVLRIIVLIISTSMLLTYTTTPISLTDAIEALLAPLSRIGVPVHDFSMMMTIALRFIPTLTEETEKIMNAQKARGADFSTGGPVKRIRALVPIIIPLFISAFRRANDLASAMECRCYAGGEGRTRMKVLKTGAVDYVFCAAAVAVGAAVILLNIFAPGYKLAF